MTSGPPQSMKKDEAGPREQAGDPARPATLAQLRAEVERQLGQRPLFAVLLTTAVNGHRHHAYLDENGCGHTRMDESGHSHDVTEYFLRSREKHVHDLVIP